MFDITGQKRWGIIGDGQLARMLALNAYTLGIRPVVLTGDSSSPAGQVTPLIVRGHVDNREDLHALLSQVEGAIIESEFVDCEALESTGLSEKVFPKVGTIRILQNKYEQKRLLNSLGIQSSQFFDLTGADLLQQVQSLTNNFTRPLVLKFATFGYDGKGVLLLRGRGFADREQTVDFLTTAAKRRIQVFAEDLVDFEKELAMIAVRRADGISKTWPLVVSEQRQGICERITGPATSLGIDSSLETKAQLACEKIGANLGIIGVYAIEFFLTSSGELLVNEIAPRVHNSGHYTQNAGCTSQFENHWRAVLGMSLGSTETVPFFAMQNLLGPSEVISKECAQAPTGSELLHVHWYGKRGISPGRKLGHLNTISHQWAARGDCLSALHSAYGRWQDEQRQKFNQTNIVDKGPP
jgi:phosphoribosylaminoimidazole carboxylase PurK protein